MNYQDRSQKKRQRRLCLLYVLLIVLLSSSAVYASSSKVAMNIWGFDYDNAVSQITTLSRKLGGMKVKRSKKYDSVYFVGKRVKMGVSIDAEYGAKNNEYLRITNSGNKRLTIKGVKIGNSRETVIKKMCSLKGGTPFQSYNKGSLFWAGNSLCVKAYYKKGKLKKWIYIIAPSG